MPSNRIDSLALLLRQTVRPRLASRHWTVQPRCLSCIVSAGPTRLAEQRLQDKAPSRSRHLSTRKIADDQVAVRADTQASESPLLQHLKQRGLLQDLTSSAVHSHLEKDARTIYLGVDPSASSLHIGNLLPLLALVHLTVAGHKALLLVGGATGSIGDPSGRSSERNALDPEKLESNVCSIRNQVNALLSNVERYLQRRKSDSSNSEGTAAKLQIEVINNADWYEGVSLLQFLGSVGRFVRVGDMLARDSVASRLGLRNSGGNEPASSSPPGMSFTEFSYQLLQAYDFSVLHGGPHQCTLQLGGSDQLGNIMAGVDLIMRKNVSLRENGKVPEEEIKPAYGITVPLLTTASGAKFGKSAGNAIWLDAASLSDLDFYQYFWRSADADVEKYLKSLTLMPLEDIASVLQRHAQDPSQRVAQTVLAEEVLELVRGPEAVVRAKKASEVLFTKDLTALDPDEVRDAFSGDARLVQVQSSDFDGKTIIDLCGISGATSSRSEARRMIQQGGLYLNGKQIKDPGHTLTKGDLLQDRFCMLKVGKAGHRVIFVNY